MKEILNRLFEHQTLSKAEATDILKNLALGQYNAAQIASFLTVYMMRNITVEELEGFREAMLSLCIATDLSAYAPMDLCGTGGDGKNTFNISTLSAFVVAASGVKVAKHGNHGVSSVSGSSTVLEYFGVQFSAAREDLERSLEATNLCFLHAPLFHPAMKNVGPIRRDLGVKTFFNMLGPMVNPAFPTTQLVGVFSLELARLYNYLYQRNPVHYLIVHALDGYDEVSLTGEVKILGRGREEILQPTDFGLSRLRPDEIYGGNSVAASARVFAAILRGEGSLAQQAAVAANAGLAIHCAHPEMGLEDCVGLAQENLVSGKALATFEKFLAYNQ
ncbi:MAG: anthranilate phosphoribosyltransferase [Microscillaceae bacterium]|nr:anthranilate phosphoribosyltransferase [Microscillaceae bacterium]